MMDRGVLIRSITEATSEVFSMMLDLQVRVASPGTDRSPSDAGLIALVGITGEWNGSGVFSCSPRLASLICSRMLGTDFDLSGPVIDVHVLDAVAEVTNMMIGNLTNILEQYAGPLAVSAPAAIYGRNVEFRNGAGLKGTTVVFQTGEERFEVRVALAPSRERTPLRPRIPVMGLAHI